jgi:hypothetical protein
VYIVQGQGAPEEEKNMQPLPSATALFPGFVVILLLLGGRPAAAAPPGQPPETLTVDEAIACIRTAVAAQTGFIKDVAGDNEGGKRRCGVELVDETGKRHKLHIDVHTNQVIKAK